MSDNTQQNKTKPRKNSGRSTSNHLFVISRFAIVIAGILLIALGIVFKLVDTTVVHASDWNKKAGRMLNDTIYTTPLRGEILASDGSILATNLNYYDIRIDFHASRFRIIEYSDSIPMLADSLAKYFTFRSRQQWIDHLSKPLSKPRSERSRNYLLVKAVPESMVKKVKKFPFFRMRKNANYTGLKTDEVLKRAYPYGDMAQLSIGRVGEVPTGGVHGISGLEKALDSMLFGEKGMKTKRLFTRGAGYCEERAPKKGHNLTTTIDVTMQDILEYELGDMLVKSHAHWGTAILMEVATGDIKAISNLERDTTKNDDVYFEAMNRAVLAYEPGSVMKVMTMAVALKEGYAHPISRLYNIEGGGYPYGGRKRISDTHSPSQLPVSRFMEYSSNIGMVKLTMPHFESNPNGFRAKLAEMGFFDRFNTGIALEQPPFFPKLTNDAGGRLNLSRMVFGYTTMIPPLYTCAFYNAIANDGRFVRPRMVKSMQFHDGRDSVIPVSYVRDRILSPEDAAILRKMMHDVVWEQGGTAKALRDKTVEIAGKTGTCKIAREAPRDSTGKRIKNIPFTPGYIEGHYRVAFCGFFPYENPKYTCIVVISDPHAPYRGPAVSSGTVLKNVAKKLYARGLFPSPADSIDSRESGKPVQPPTLYASYNYARNAVLHKDLHLSDSRAIKYPQKTEGRSVVPDVRGIGLREALARLEGAGYSVDFSGIGYVESQQPEPGTKAGPRTKVKLNLRHLN